jgi:hypothetical protein
MADWTYGGRLDDYKYYHRIHHHRNRRHAAVTAFCLIAAFVLFLFVALSLLIIKTIFLLQLDGHTASNVPATSVGTELRFGVWGFCAAHARTLRIDQDFSHHVWAVNRAKLKCSTEVSRDLEGRYTVAPSNMHTPSTHLNTVGSMFTPY